MRRILILYSTVDGQTRKIAQRIQSRLEATENQVQLAEIDHPPKDMTGFDTLVVGASIRYGHYRPAVLTFVRDNLGLLERKRSAFFSVNLVARKPEKSSADSNPYVAKFLKLVPWRPQLLDVFAGSLDYPALGFWDRHIIRFIMWITKGPTDPSTVREFTDWGRVEAFADRLAGE
ncbi:menaquinone-dependent protoporphyrinogen IX dehydrogenase [Ferrimonas sediminicola]|uniref:Protoporphyrinogen IX dehydrogenase [quinone] n=1 Tax=Ferrimonas sediminicola TaxID=2569538 RepID=A0A4U1B8W7_9GAMM|nr:menaquinone-dependent protoporphyrinogen IX dehydrogenase [Ferrimonas sediminicola]TKB46976.1 menaquinone-dependent protoporphyrinogen IX dehydrogenase [Ferrimonas sediminicola]